MICLPQNKTPVNFGIAGCTFQEFCWWTKISSPADLSNLWTTCWNHCRKSHSPPHRVFFEPRSPLNLLALAPAACKVLVLRDLCFWVLPRSLGGSTCGEGSKETPEMMEGEGCPGGLEGGVLFFMFRVQDGFDWRCSGPNDPLEILVLALRYTQALFVRIRLLHAF